MGVVVPRFHEFARGGQPKRESLSQTAVVERFAITRAEISGGERSRAGLATRPSEVLGAATRTAVAPRR
jgi:hypothetical protein